MISLIINADDLGRNPERDRGILEAFSAGIVTSASLLANGPTFLPAVAQVKALGLPVGVHLNLAEGLTLTGVINGLTDATGLLPGKQLSRQRLSAGTPDLSAIRKEIAAQVERLFNEGLQPDHLDSHQHCHLFPCLTGMVTEVAVSYGISAMRATLPQEPAENDPDSHVSEELTLYRKLARDAQETVHHAGLKTPHGIWGLPLLDRLDTETLCRLLEEIPEGIWELLTHPGYPYAQDDPFDLLPRLLELEALLSPETAEIINRRRIRLCTFGDLTCAS
jgi:predicted glycoside hydrolase/deacetylase ChbG (UPF0249 family)